MKLKRPKQSPKEEDPGNKLPEDDELD